jgi:adenylate kinase family enzyme
LPNKGLIKLIILDGFDNSGKTTLAYKIASEFGLKYLHSPSEYRWDFNKMIDWAVQEIEADRYAVYDRFSPLTDQVYGPVLRGGTPYLDDEKGQAVVELLKRTPHLIIYARPSKSQILRFGEREQMDGVVEQAEKLLVRYDALFYDLMKSDWNIVGYNYEEPGDYNYVMAKVEKFISHRKEYHDFRDR